ncbi:hypothetical protein [Burkholderia sp. MSMB1498]|uniref:hypothetical protein n=1 Tax=Burkholderia sp. MSMB1498 TaxID=1637842 RepID=UPI0012E38913|nr:hypothetical protein [Burkholderia sp. MSMB1498]
MRDRRAHDGGGARANGRSAGAATHRPGRRSDPACLTACLTSRRNVPLEPLALLRDVALLTGRIDVRLRSVRRPAVSRLGALSFHSSFSRHARAIASRDAFRFASSHFVSLHLAAHSRATFHAGSDALDAASGIGIVAKAGIFRPDRIGARGKRRVAPA